MSETPQPKKSENGFVRFPFAIGCAVCKGMSIIKISHTEGGTTYFCETCKKPLLLVSNNTQFHGVIWDHELIRDSDAFEKAKQAKTPPPVRVETRKPPTYSKIGRKAGKRRG